MPPDVAQKILFTDRRHIAIGDLAWRGPDGQAMPVAGPPEPAVPVQADLGGIPYGIEFRAQRGEKLLDQAINGPMGSRVVHEGGCYRSWALQVRYPPGQNLGAYATAMPEAVEIAYSESADGFSWEEKARSALQVPGQTSFDGATFFVDPHGPPAERYKAVYMARVPAEEAGSLWRGYASLHPRYRDERITALRVPALYAAVSADGLGWRGVAEPLMVHYSDTDTTVRWDAWLERYVMYTRLYPHRRRIVGWAESEDFYHWTPVQPLLWPGLDRPLTDDIYLNAYSSYPGLPQYHLMFPMVYDRYAQRSHVELWSSPDGLHWDPLPGGPLAEPGVRGAWDSEFIGVGRDLVPLGSDRVAVPYWGTPFPHKYPRWPHVLGAGRRTWLQWERDRLVALQAAGAGTFSTDPLPVAGTGLCVNARVPRAGCLRIGLAGVEGRLVEECDPITGDGYVLPVTWKGQPQVRVPPGTPVSLRVELRGAEVFALEWT
ncbi:MAG: hypothetical protein AB1505_09845 [Candidatus Latescibacterota bacterium]